MAKQALIQRELKREKLVAKFAKKYAELQAVVADASKFGRNATVRGGTIGDCHHLFTDRPLPADFHRIADQYSDRIRVVSDGRVQAA